MLREYIVLTVDNNTLVFDYKTISEEELGFLNKNSFYKGSLFYDIKYYKKHKDRIIDTLKKIDSKIDTLKVQRLVTFKYVFWLTEYLGIPNLKLNFLSTIDIEDYNMFLTSRSIKEIECYFMPSNIKQNFEDRGIKINTYSDKKVSIKFLQQQETILEDTLYYKKIIYIKEDYPELLSDLEEFLKVNYKLKGIHLYVYSKELIKAIVDLVKNDESRNVIVFLHQDSDKGNFIVNNFAWLKELSSDCKENYTCEFRIIYSKAFLGKNLFKQLTFNNLKLISILCIYVSIVCILLIKSYDYIEKLSIDILNNEIMQEIDNNNDTEVADDYLPDGDQPTNETFEEVKNKYVLDNSISALKKINKEVVGFLVVKNTNISYPVVQHSDNSYYLKRDIYKKSTSMGWLFMDYRNDAGNFNDNTIIYGHSMKNGTMFGTLKKTLSSSWRKDPENMIITYNTENAEYQFKIFSIYKVDYTTDYLKTTFDNDEDKLEFIKMLKDRSIFNSNTKVGKDDYIITLSTCTGSNNKRLVVHAVLLEGE